MPRTAVLQRFSQLGLRSARCQSEIPFKSALLLTTPIKPGKKKMGEREKFAFWSLGLWWTFLVGHPDLSG